TDEPTPTPPAEETPTPTPTETPTPELPKIIGTQAEGDSIIVIELQNSTGRNITSFQVKDANMGPEGLSDNMLADTWKTDETRILYFDTANYQNGTMWNVRVVFEGSENGSTITNYPFTDMKSGIFNYSQDGYLYVSFHSTSTDTDTDTLEKEKSWHSAAGTNAG
ncbi:MAG: hypothetical protein Q4B09_05655, partial [Lachnospiraceae bacterium]|nr:hypothetical protein [Lachnospiraceae bacterium]